MKGSSPSENVIFHQNNASLQRGACQSKAYIIDLGFYVVLTSSYSYVNNDDFRSSDKEH